MPRFHLYALAMLAVTVGSNVSGFTPMVQQQTKQCMSTKLSMVATEPTPPTTSILELEERPIRDISYGEESRKYRRTVFTHNDWQNFRSPDRFWRNLLAITASGIYKNISKEVLASTSVAIFLVIYNAIVSGYIDFNGIQHDALITNQFLPVLALPLTPFTLASPSLGLLLGTFIHDIMAMKNFRNFKICLLTIFFLLYHFFLCLWLKFYSLKTTVFRTNTSYKRWDEARKNWGMNINHTRDLCRLANAYYDRSVTSPTERKEDLQAVALATWSFVRAMKRHLSPEDEDEIDFQNELYEKLPFGQAQAIIDAAHRPNRALMDVSYAIENLPMNFIRKNEIHSAVTIFEDNLGSSERLLTSPVPLVYSRHTARFISVWLLTLPLGLYTAFPGNNHIMIIPTTFVLSLFLFGIEELATQLEEPFTILPMQGFCDKIYNWCNEIVSWEAGDNGLDARIPEARHMAIADGAGKKSMFRSK